MKFTASLAVIAIVACSQLAGDKTPEMRAKERCACAAPAVVERVTRERDTCVAALADHAEQDADAAASDAPKPRGRTRVVKETVQVPAPPRRCAGDAPKILAVESVKCEGGRLCLDEKAQIALAANLAAYEKWVRDVQECEREP